LATAHAKDRERLAGGGAGQRAARVGHAHIHLGAIDGEVAGPHKGFENEVGDGVLRGSGGRGGGGRRQGRELWRPRGGIGDLRGGRRGGGICRVEASARDEDDEGNERRDREQDLHCE